METDRQLSRKLVRSTIAEYEGARAAGNVELMAALHEVSRAAYEIETRFEKLESATTTAMLAVVTADDAVAQKLYLRALEQNKREPDEESYVWRLHLSQRFLQAGLVPLREDLIECQALASHLGDRDAIQQADAMLASVPV
jgi:hypothetical protein